eukprot:scaffold185734_cov35-Attheya_sp.AAC.1
MDIILKSKAFTKREMEIINACRLYLQVTRVSDISTADGRQVMIQMLTGACTQEQVRTFRTTHIE